MIKQCPICGNDFETPYAYRKYCSDACSSQKDRQRKHKCQSPHIKKKVDTAIGKPVKTLSDWAREAAECN